MINLINREATGATKVGSELVEGYFQDVESKKLVCDAPGNKRLATGKKHHVYAAGPWFYEGQEERLEKIEAMLRYYGYTFFAPRLDGVPLPKDATAEDRQKTFMDNVDGITNAEFIIAVTDGKDTGTLWEAGCAFGANIPVVFFAETLPEDAQFNLMLAESGVAVCRSFDDLSKYLSGVADKIAYEGYIQ